MASPPDDSSGTTKQALSSVLPRANLVQEMVKRPDMKPLKTSAQHLLNPEGPRISRDPFDQQYFVLGMLCELLTIWTALELKPGVKP